RPGTVRYRGCPGYAARETSRRQEPLSGARARRDPRLEDAERGAQERRGGVHGVREVVHRDTDACHAVLEREALRGAAPVVTLEDDVEAHVLPGRELVGPDLGDRVVDDRERAHDLEALRERDHRRAALDALGVLV